mgnify:CR=1 FL=1
MGAPLFTVFTPTFDRAHTLHRVRESLERQTLRDFEWVVVDDGSTDDTARVLERWARDSAFPIRFERQPNAGKHVAIRRGVTLARGALFLIHDSDDGCVPEALARFAHHWHAIPAEDRDRFAGVTAACRDAEGRPVGDPLPSAVLDATALELRYRHGVAGERWGFVRTGLLRRFPFPDRPVGTYVPESLVWDRIGRDHLTRFIDEPLRIYHVDGSVASVAHGRHPARNAPGSFLQYEAVLNEQLDWFRYAPGAFLRAAAYFVRFGLHAGYDLAEQRGRLKTLAARTLWVAAVPFGYAAWKRDGNEA